MASIIKINGRKIVDNPDYIEVDGVRYDKPCNGSVSINNDSISVGKFDLINGEWVNQSLFTKAKKYLKIIKW
ncbi:hypothetical protein HYO65_gp084 [Tenacibaculum phage PTm1]|uniref:Uncharacterized protein n=2 Tax=Shirahamavirus PTm1 TaxID=2846435 RepID=A0A5S9HXQ6_9CAUD|nr:hypothetical protein HYO65_gp084 [Tenacibaculum phage PTm1]BBI90476.1 hypothetical protein [Tenacibaculum phage PTm1]BBI90783.1 hypothetical protein [Tenacibaculum phage PTm5]